MSLVILAAGTTIYQGGRFLVSLIAAPILGPADFGTWSLLSVLLLYSNFVSLGVANGLGRDVPFLLGAERHEEAATAEDVGLGVTVMAAFVAAAAGGVVAMVVAAGSGGPLLVPAFVVAVFLQQFYLLQQILLRSRLRFRPAGVQLALLGLLIVPVGVSALSAGLDGLVLAQAAVMGLALVVATRTLARVPRPKVNLTVARRLVTHGFPIMLAGLLFGVLSTVDRWLVFLFLEREAVGHFGLASLTTSGLVLVSSVVSQQAYPQLSFGRGEGRTVSELRFLAVRRGALSGALTGGAVVVVVLVAVVAIPAWLPEYVPATWPMIIAAVGAFIYSFGAVHGDLLNAIGQSRPYLLTQAAAIVMNVALGIGVLSLGGGLVGLALTELLTISAYTGLLVRATKRASNS